MTIQDREEKRRMKNGLIYAINYCKMISLIDLRRHVLSEKFRLESTINLHFKFPYILYTSMMRNSTFKNLETFYTLVTLISQYVTNTFPNQTVNRAL